ncbi:site-specific integrase [Arthrobacter sp. AETb3-4]|uniref:Site-specific integrase n=1 Tax=Arthrobacter wenxiniae TaxID=2713570 RepID=A0A7Y7IH22_9MICC|nr:site-specific integrase [Arthrobacter wenxiniae]
MARAWIEYEWLTADKQQTAKHGVGKRWRAYWWEAIVPDAQGRTKRRRSQQFGRKGDAEQFVTKIENDLRARTYRPPENAETLVAVVAAEWLATRLNIKPATYRRYERELRSYVLPKWESVKIGTITKAQVAGWIAHLSASTAPARYKIRGTEPAQYHRAGTMRRPLTPASVDHLHTVFSAVMGWAVETDRIGRNPAAGVKLPRVIPADHVYLSHEQVDDLATAAHGVTDAEMDRALFQFLAYTGLRIDEALALTVGDLNLFRPAPRSCKHEPSTRPASGYLVPRKLTSGAACRCRGSWWTSW